MAAADLLQQTLQPNDVQIAAALGNLYRCGSYPRMVQALRISADALREKA